MYTLSFLSHGKFTISLSGGEPLSKLDFTLSPALPFQSRERLSARTVIVIADMSTVFDLTVLAYGYSAGFDLL